MFHSLVKLCKTYQLQKFIPANTHTHIKYSNLSEGPEFENKYLLHSLLYLIFQR